MGNEWLLELILNAPTDIGCDVKGRRYRRITASDGLEYRIFLEGVVEGDFCRSYPAEQVVSPDWYNRVVLRVPYTPDDNDLIENESRVLIGRDHISLPAHFGSFLLGDRQVNVLQRIKGFDLISIRKQFPAGLPQEHTVWLLQRLLAVTGYVHRIGYVHGMIQPGCIIVTPENHNAFLTEYLLCTSRDVGRYRGVGPMSAPEVSLEETKPHPTADIWSIGEVAIYILGGEPKTRTFPPDIHPEFQDFVWRMVQEQPTVRPDDAWKLHEELKTLRAKLFGPKKFLPLSLNEEDMRR